MTEKEPKNNSTDLETIKLMLAYICIKEEGNLVDKIKILDLFNFTDAQRAQVCQVNVQKIRDTRSRAKKKSSKRKVKKTSKKEKK